MRCRKMKAIARINGKKVILDTNSDQILYDAPTNPPNTGTTYTRGSDYFVHTSKSGRYFYRYNWSMWQGEGSSIEVLTEDEAKEELEGYLGVAYGLDDDEIEAILGIWPDFLKEDE